MGCRTSFLTAARRGPVTSFVNAHLLGYSGSKCRLRSSHPAGLNESDNPAPPRAAFGVGCGARPPDINTPRDQSVSRTRRRCAVSALRGSGGS